MKSYPKSLKVIIQTIITLIVIIGLWQLFIFVFQPPAYIVPSPLSVGHSLVNHFNLLMFHSGVTLKETLLGLFLGVAMGLAFALILLLNKNVNRWLLPILIISQSIPIFALAPILVLWLGYGLASKVAMAALIVFFPITLCCYDGLKNTPKGYLELAQTFQLTRWQTLVRVKLPAALPTFASGLRLAVIFAPIGAVFGEWIGASAGLGYYMNQNNAQMQVGNMFAALFILSLLSVSLYFITDFLLKRWIFWQSTE